MRHVNDNSFWHLSLRLMHSNLSTVKRAIRLLTREIKSQERKEVASTSVEMANKAWSMLHDILPSDNLMNQMIIEARLIELVITKECRLYCSAWTTSGG
jgi:hypothetical protein